ncbi:MAG: GNAT family N-acetyltransferase [Bifidobacterium psychraerophilum]|uniref:GNAT family N-acetyltransferase n=1 Tax=Bifidobacterium psychraerophilum TaxID=218140 RepID=UPI0039E838CD
MITAINTDRLVLRNYQDRDAAALLEYRAHPTVHCFARERLGSLAEAQRDIREKSGDDLQLAVCTKDDDRLIGSVFAEFDQPDTSGLVMLVMADRKILTYCMCLTANSD